MKRKAAIELSVTAIVILILAIVMLGLGLGFIRGMFGKVSTQIEEQISIEPEPSIPTASNPITLSREKIITYPKEVNVLKIGAYNPTNIDWVSEAHSENLVGYWNFDNIDGNIVKDLSGNGNDGTIYWATPSPDGKYGNALSFDGDGDYVDVGAAASLNIIDAITIVAWIYPKSAITGTIVAKNGPYYLGFGNSQTGQTQRVGGGIHTAIGAWAWLAGNSIIPINTWSHIAVRYDGSTIKVYFNGNEDGSTPKSGTITVTSDTVKIGYGTPGFNQYFNGLIDDVMIFNKALTEEDVQELYETGVTPEVVCDSSSMSGLMSSVNGRIIRQGESANFNYLMRLPGNVPEGEYLCKVILMDYQKDFTIEVKK